ncbi:hypothetical protein [Acidovorax carolinensis]|uniref:hypothetical protein n=1 Tax=Acidovorax carolinensis TaxID=553814 RepID=UPI0012FFC50C|nr:hypothetical protein [Acidovorax carolinensis]
MLNEIRRSLSKACSDYSSTELTYDNALTARADDIFDDEDPDEYDKNIIEEERYQSHNYIFNDVGFSLPRLINYIVFIPRHAGCKIEPPTSKNEAINLIFSIIESDPYNDRDEELFPIYYFETTNLKKYSTNAPSTS